MVRPRNSGNYNAHKPVKAGLPRSSSLNSPLDNQKEKCILPLDPQEERAYVRQAERSRPGHSGHAHSENACPRTHSRIWDRRPARTDEQRGFSGECGFAVCRVSAAATRRTHKERMESHGEQQASKVLRPDRPGAKEAQ